jgi:membrane-bound serine protease (ClpP class)
MSLVTSSVAIYYISKNFGSLPIMNRLILKTPTGEDLGEGMLAAMGEPDRVGPQVGDRGTAVTPLRPSGRIQIGDQLYDVVAEMGYISAGQGVRVTSVSEFRVTVDALPPGETGVA